MFLQIDEWHQAALGGGQFGIPFLHTTASHRSCSAGSPRRKSARSKLEGAIKFVQQINQELEHDQQWAITQSLIGSLTGSNISLTVKPFWTEIKSEMELYSHSLAMDDRTNYGRAGEVLQLKDDFVIWLDAQIQEWSDSTRRSNAQIPQCRRNQNSEIGQIAPDFRVRVKTCGQIARNDNT